LGVVGRLKRKKNPEGRRKKKMDDNRWCLGDIRHLKCEGRLRKWEVGRGKAGGSNPNSPTHGKPPQGQKRR